MAVSIPNFDQVWKHVKDTCQLPTEVEWGNVGLQVGNIQCCPQIPKLRMQRVSLNTLLSYVSESHFCPKDASSTKANKETAILLLFISNASYTDIEYIHIGLVVIHRGYKVGDQASIVPYILFIQNQLVEMSTWAQKRKSSLSQLHSFCLFMEDYESMMVLPMEPLYCLVYPIHFFNDMRTDLRNQLHMDLFAPGLHCWECVCCQLIQQENLHEKWETIMASSCFLKYTGPSPEVPLTVSASASVPTSSASDTIMQGGMPKPDSTLPPAATANGTVTADLMPAPQGGVHCQCQASKSPSH